MSIPDSIRQLVKDRAGNCCEYCRIGEVNRLIPFQVEHIIARKHQGTDQPDNLCLACYKCNSFKGSNIAAIDPETGQASLLFHPRKQVWEDHFQLREKRTITPLTPEGRTTVAVLRLNDANRLQQRQMLMQQGTYPCNPSLIK